MRTPPDPSRFEVDVVGANTTVDLGGSTTQYLHLNAPQSAVIVHGGANTNYYGWIVGKTLSFIGGSNLHYDETRNDGEPYKISLVK